MIAQNTKQEKDPPPWRSKIQHERGSAIYTLITSRKCWYNLLKRIDRKKVPKKKKVFNSSPFGNVIRLQLAWQIYLILLFFILIFSPKFFNSHASFQEGYPIISTKKNQQKWAFWLHGGCPFMIHTNEILIFFFSSCVFMNRNRRKHGINHLSISTFPMLFQQPTRGLGQMGLRENTIIFNQLTESKSIWWYIASMKSFSFNVR